MGQEVPTAQPRLHVALLPPGSTLPPAPPAQLMLCHHPVVGPERPPSAPLLSKSLRKGSGLWTRPTAGNGWGTSWWGGCWKLHSSPHPKECALAPYCAGMAPSNPLHFLAEVKWPSHSPPPRRDIALCPPSLCSPLGPLKNGWSAWLIKESSKRTQSWSQERPVWPPRFPRPDGTLRAAGPPKTSGQELKRRGSYLSTEQI